MNRKETPEQNDISIIIGNLPKRLQEKIISREGKRNSSIANAGIHDNSTGSSSNGKENNICVGGRDNVDDSHVAQLPMVNPSNPLSNNNAEFAAPTKSNGGHVTSIDYFLRLSAKKEHEKVAENVAPVLEASGSLMNSSVKEKKCETQTNVVVPGLIRLNVEDVKKLNECKSEDSKYGLRNHDKRYRHQSRQETLLSKCVLPMSPVRHIPKVNHPSWFKTLDNSDAQHLPSLFESLQNELDRSVTEEVIY